MKHLTLMAVGLLSLLASGTSSAQNGSMMDSGGMWGGGWMSGYASYCWPILLVVVVGLIVWVVLKRRK